MPKFGQQLLVRLLQLIQFHRADAASICEKMLLCFAPSSVATFGFELDLWLISPPIFFGECDRRPAIPREAVAKKIANHFQAKEVGHNVLRR
jgi:hypothetical protein